MILFVPRYWRWYGMWDYGDLIHCGPNASNPQVPAPRFPIGPQPPLEHGRWDTAKKFKQQFLANTHYDLIEALLFHYLRTGKREYYRFAEMSALHVNEVDCLYPCGSESAVDVASDAKGDRKRKNREDDDDDESGKGRFGYTSRHGCGHGQISGSHAFIRFRMPLYFLSGNERVKDAMRLAYQSARNQRAKIFGNGVTIRDASCATKILETWWVMSGDKEAEEHVKFILHYWVSRQQTKDDLGNYVGINKTWGRTKGGANEAFDPYNIMPKAKHEVLDPNSWDHPEHKQTIGWRFMNFGASEAMIDWHILTGDEKVGQSVARFIRATLTHGTIYNWGQPQQLLNCAWRITHDEQFRQLLRPSMVFSRWSEINKPETTIDLKDNMVFEDFQREFTKFYTKDHFKEMSIESAVKRVLIQPYAMYVFEPYDKAFPVAFSTGESKPAPNKSGKSTPKTAP